MLNNELRPLFFLFSPPVPTIENVVDHSGCDGPSSSRHAVSVSPATRVACQYQ